MTRDEWLRAHEIEKAEGGSSVPVHPEAFLVDTSLSLEPQFLDAIRRCWPSISSSSYALIRINNPLERN